MTRLPSNKTIFISLLSLLLLYNIAFYTGVYDRLEQSRYLWEQMKIIDSIKPVKLLSASRANMDIMMSHKSLPSPKWTYILVNHEQTYPFRFKYIVTHHDSLRFFGIKWIKGMPKDFTKQYTLQMVDVPLKKEHRRK